MHAWCRKALRALVKIEAQRAGRGVRFWNRGQRAPPHQLWDEERCKFPSGIFRMYKNG